MKKRLIWLLVCMMLLGVCACGGGSGKEESVSLPADKTESLQLNGTWTQVKEDTIEAEDPGYLQ
ncbi:MAG: hypothetical protein IJ773_11685 [Lachnospiraceae bacterium]|nr:hypothetical protein [Lachnospiraceae bacterium]